MDHIVKDNCFMQTILEIMRIIEKKNKYRYMHILTPWRTEPRGSMSHSQGLFNIPILNRINPIVFIYTYFFKIQSSIVLPSKPRPFLRYLFCRIYCIVLKGWSLLPNALRPFQDLLCSPEFGF